MRVFVYKNLHKNLWSIKSKDTGKVIGHTHNVWLKNPIFKVSIKGRDRVIREKKKYVHAGVEGELLYDADNIGLIYEYELLVVDDLANAGRLANFPLYYNPYKVDTFVNPYTCIPPKNIREKYGHKFFELDYAVLNLHNEFPVIGYEIV